MKSVFPLDEYEQRIANVRRAMETRGLKALVVLGARNWYRDHTLRYLANYDVVSEPAAMVLPLVGEAALVLRDAFDMERAKELTWIADVSATASLGDAIAERLAARGVMADSVGVAGAEALGFSGIEVLPVGARQAIADRCPRVQLTAVDSMIDDIRAIRSPRELEVLRQVARISDIGAETFRAITRSGVSEREIFTDVWHSMQSAGAEDVHISFCRGPGSFWPHPASDARLEDGDIVSIELSPRHHGYFSQANRIAFIGKMTREKRELAQLALDARQVAFGAIRAGTPAADVVQQVAKLVARSQLGTMDMGGPHRIGHGCALALDEPPFLTSANKAPLLQGMTMAVHPIVYLPYIHSLLIFGDYALITDKGAESLTTPQTEVVVA